MEFYGPEGKKLKKSDTTLYYYPPKSKRLTMTPYLTSSDSEVKKFLGECSGMSKTDIEDLWTKGMNNNQIIIEAMETLKSEKESSGDFWGSKSYSKAVGVFKSLKVPIVSGEQVIKIKGIGKGIAGYVDSILKTGRLKSEEERIEETIKRENIIEKFMEVWGATKAATTKWYGKGYRTIGDLSEEKLTSQQTLGVKYFDELSKKMDRDTIDNIFQGFRKDILKSFKSSIIECVGPYRRGYSSISELEINISYTENESPSKKLKQIIQILDIKEIAYEGKEIFLGIIIQNKIRRKVCVKLVPIDVWGVSLLLDTGPKTYITQIKQQASQMGYKIADSGLYKLTVKDDGDEFIVTRKETDVFSTIGLGYVPPDTRL